MERAPQQHPLTSKVWLPTGVMLGLCGRCSEVHEYDPPLRPPVAAPLPLVEEHPRMSLNRMQRRSRRG